MKIGIIGTRGIPNQYGGFEQLAEYLSVGLVKKGHEVTVYNIHDHAYQEKTWNGVTIIHCYNPEARLGTAGQFIYDLNCVLDARKRNFDVLLVLGYTSISVWGRLFPRNSTIVINMDGLEWKRTKYSRPVQRFLRYAERLGIRFSDKYIADSPAIQSYLKEKYGVESRYIAYGAEILDNEDSQLLDEYGLRPGSYCMLMARMEPENNIETILDGFTSSRSDKIMVVVGNPSNKFGTYLKNKFSQDSRIRFIGAVYDGRKVHALKLFSFLYFHGHSVGGTNPSLLEAMASRTLIVAHDNPFNRAILEKDAFYFSNADQVRQLLEKVRRNQAEAAMIDANLRKIREDFTWDKIIGQYESFLVESHMIKKN